MKASIAAALLLLFLAWVPASTTAATKTQMDALGVIRVTDSPYSADPTGVTDSTAAIQAAVDTAFNQEKMCLFPEGTYLISNTINCINFVDDRGRSSHYNTHQLVGSTKGTRPKIRLKNSAAGFGNANAPKPAVFFSAQDINGVTKNSVNFNQGIRNIELDLGTGNPGGTGIDMEASQHSFIEDVKINVNSGYSGLYNLAGQKCILGNIEIVGGKYGIVAPFGRYPGLSGVKLINQTDYAIFGVKCHPVLLVGFHIQKAQAPAIKIDKGYANSQGDLTLVDGIIEFETMNTSTAIDNSIGQTVAMQNVYVRNASKIVQSLGKPAINGGAAWKRVKEYVFPRTGTPGINLVNGVKNTNEYSTVDSATPPPDLVTRHIWNPDDFPSPDDICDQVHGSPVNPKMAIATEHGVVPAATTCSINITSGTDCTTALQSVLANYETVFLPKGQYLISDTITLRDKTVLLGVGNSFSGVRTHVNWKPTTNNRADVIRTVDSVSAAPKLAYIQLSYMTTPADNDYFTSLHWRAGKNSLTKSIYTAPLYSQPVERGNDKHDIIYSGNAGGRHWAAGNGSPSGTYSTGHRRIYLDRTSEPLLFYNLNVEDGHGAYQAEAYQCQNVVIFSQKAEDQPVFHFNNCENCAFISGKGTNNIRFTNPTNALALDLGPKFSDSTGTMLTEVYGGVTTTISQFNQVVGIYKRGVFDWADVYIPHDESEDSSTRRYDYE